jgi:membrane protein DedA with SNARE-associated domain
MPGMEVKPSAADAEELTAELDAPAEHQGVTVTRADVLCLGPLILLTIFGLAMIPVAPSLIGSHPVLLSAIYGSPSSMLASGAVARTGSASLWVVCVAPIVALMIRDPFLYWAGRRYGRRLVDHLARQDPRWRRRMARSDRWFERWGPWAIAFGYYIPFVPAALFYLAAGETRMRIRTFVFADLVGTLTWIGIHVGAGYAIGKPATDLAKTISRYGLWVGLGIVVLVIGWSVFSSVRQARIAAAD